MGTRDRAARPRVIDSQRCWDNPPARCRGCWDDDEKVVDWAAAPVAGLAGASISAWRLGVMTSPKGVQGVGCREQFVAVKTIIEIAV